ncbi:hypothetical protein IT575_03185 [bacterium]|nr:hypothetical protein [bacterium]
MIRTGTLYLAELRKLARADGRLHLAVSVLSVMLAGLVLGARVDPQLGVYSLRSLLAAWPSVLLAGALGLGLLAPAYYWALAQYRYYCAWTLLDSGLMYLALEHEPAEMLGALASRERRARHGAAGLLGAGAGAGQAGGALSFRGRMDALLRSYGACCNALLYQAWPAPLRWLDLGVIFISAAGLIWIGLLIGTAVLPYMLNPYGAAPGAQVLGQLRLAALCVLAAMLMRGCLRRARFDALRLALADVLEGED